MIIRSSFRCLMTIFLSVFLLATSCYAADEKNAGLSQKDKDAAVKEFQDAVKKAHSGKDKEAHESQDKQYKQHKPDSIYPIDDENKGGHEGGGPTDNHKSDSKSNPDY